MPLPLKMKLSVTLRMKCATQKGTTMKLPWTTISVYNVSLTVFNAIMFSLPSQHCPTSMVSPTARKIKITTSFSTRMLKILNVKRMAGPLRGNKLHQTSLDS